MNDKVRKLKELEAKCNNCTLCPLHSTRNNVVFGGGEPASIMLIGEAPGKNEDLQGEPFVGAAGKRLKMLLGEAGINEYYIANVLKCRPPKNRNPKTDEVLRCAQYLDYQIEIVNPKIIIPMGNFATMHVLGEYGISKLRGQIRKVNDWYVTPIYHPAATIYNKSLIEVTIKDLRQAKRLLDKT